MRFTSIFFLVVIAELTLARSASAEFVNGDFETGDLTGWTASAIGGSPLISVVMPATNHFAEFETGDFATGPFISTLEQTITVDPSKPLLSFDFTLPTTTADATGIGASPFLDGFFVSATAGGSFFDLLLVDQFGALADPFGTAPSAVRLGAPSASGFDFGLTADLSSLATQSVTILFDVINEDDGFESTFALDNVQFSGSGGVVPEPSTIVLWGLGVVGFGFRSMRRRRRHPGIEKLDNRGRSRLSDSFATVTFGTYRLSRPLT